MIKQLIYGWCLLTALLVATSCVNDGDDGLCRPSEAEGTEKVHVMFTIAMDNLGKQYAPSRGTWEEDATEAATEYENRIQPGRLQVLIYDLNDRLVGEVENISYVRHDGAYNNVYDILGDLTLDKLQIGTDLRLQGRMVVLAGWDTPAAGDAVTVGALMTALNPLAFTYDVAGTAAMTKCIPMWGIHAVDLQLAPGRRNNAGTIFMLRALSKLRVALSDATARDYRLTAVRVSDYNTSGYIVPSGYEGKNETTQLNSEGSLRQFLSRAATALPFVTETADRSMFAYVPEYVNADNPAPATLSVEVVRLADNAVKTYTVDLKNHADGTPLNLVRNTIYNFTVTGISDRLDVELAYQVMAWDEKGGDIEFNSTER